MRGIHFQLQGFNTFPSKIKNLIQQASLLGFSINFVAKLNNSQVLLEFYSVLNENKYFDDQNFKFPYLDQDKLKAIDNLLKYLRKLSFNGSNINFENKSFEFMKLFIKEEIIPESIKQIQSLMFDNYTKMGISKKN